MEISAVKDMMFVHWGITSLEFKVRLFTKLKPNNSEAVCLENSWTVCEQTRHVDVLLNFIREMKKL